MSRIDQALRIWEGATGTDGSQPGVNQSGAATSLNEYPREAPTEYEPDAPPAVPPLRPRQPEIQSGSRNVVTRAVKLPDNPDSKARLVTSASSPVSVEQYRRVAVVLHEEQVQKQLKTVMITSALPQDGKTLTVINLALTLSESYARRVLVIDGDLRCPTVHQILNIPNDCGLSEALRDTQRELPFVTVSSRLSVLTAGQPGRTPLAGLTSTRMKEVIEECAARFDWVLIDTSPVGVLPDAQVLARLVGGVIFVIGAGSTPAAAVERAIAELGPESIIGTVLNRVEHRQIPEAGYYSHYGRPAHLA